VISTDYKMTRVVVTTSYDSAKLLR